MKILFVSTLYAPNAVGGAEATVKLLAEGVARTGDEAVVVSLAPDGRHTEGVVNGVRVHYLPLWNVYFPHGPGRRPVWLKPVWQAIEAFNPVMARRLGAIIDAEAPDVVNIHNLQGFSAAAWWALSRRAVPVVQTLHDHYTVCVNSVMYRQQRNCTQRCLRCRVLCAPRAVLSRRVDVVSAVSERLRQRIAGFGAFAGVADSRVIYGCNVDAETAPRRASPEPGAALRLGFLGRLDPIKGLEMLLEAAEGIGPERVRVSVGGAGEPAYDARLRARFAGPSVEFLGHVAASDFFGGIDALVVPSLVEEALGRVVHEALGAGVPVIGAAIGGIPEMIREGETGFLFPAGDAAALQGLLQRLLQTPPDWAAMSADCLADSGRFTYERIFAQYRAAWAAAIAGRAAPLAAPLGAEQHRLAPGDPAPLQGVLARQRNGGAA